MTAITAGSAAAISIRIGIVTHTNSETMCCRKAAARSEWSRVLHTERYIARNVPPATTAHTPKITPFTGLMFHEPPRRRLAFPEVFC
jgi:hypothetical protein